MHQQPYNVSAANPYATVPDATFEAPPYDPKTTDVVVQEPEIDPKNQFSLLTKVHLAVALITCIGSFLIWHYISENPQTAFWWWIYPFFFFLL